MVSVSETEVRFTPSSRGASEEGAVEVTVKPSSGKMPATRRQSSESSRRSRSGRCCPKLFERASGSWWDPKFNSAIIEEQFQKQSFPQWKKRFRYAVGYALLVCLTWMIYLPIRANSLAQQCDWIVFEIALGCMVGICIALIAFTTCRYYRPYVIHTSLVFIVVECGLTLASFASFTDGCECDNKVLSTVATFAICVETILMTYTVIPLPFLYCVGTMMSFSFLYEILFFTTALQPYEVNPKLVFAKLFLHICVHMMGMHIFLMSQVRNRSTFLKIVDTVVAQSLHAREKQIKEATIKSLMPDIIAKELLRSKESNNLDVKSRGPKGRKQSSEPIFRPFYMNRMENVSILYADIAGFTKMSANKSAEKLVGLLNNLFGRFDHLCRRHNCEKICTLGDCYYCVSGCPVLREDHAQCCVEMGLSMIEAIKDFCQETGEKVNMRVGIHTGTVLCGIVGNRRFKFDVWSNDVTIANKMEASGQPGKVHVSAESIKFLGDRYVLDEGNADKHALLIGMKTYFIAGRHASASPVTKPASNAASARSLDTAPHGSLSNAAAAGAATSEDTDSDRGEGGEAKLEAASRKPLLAVSASGGAKGSGASLEETAAAGDAVAAAEDGKGGAQNHAENPAGGGDTKPENGGVVSQQQASGGATPLEGVALTESIILHHGEETNSDNQVTKFLEQNEHIDYFQKPPISNCTLRFLDSDVEDKYHSQFTPDYMQPDRKEENGDGKRKDRRHSSETISTTRYNTLLDVSIAFAMFILFGIACFLVFNIPVPWRVFFPVVTILQLIVLLAMVREAFCRNLNIIFAEYIAALFHNWYRRHLLGALLLSCPVLAVYTNYTCDESSCFGSNALFFCFLLIVSLLHFCNFVQLNVWMKSLLALLSGTILLVLLFICKECTEIDEMNVLNMSTPTPYDLAEATPTSLDDLCLIQRFVIPWEVVLDIILLLVLIFFLNREYEIGFRLNYFSNYQALEDRKKMQLLQDEAETLLHHIVPQFVTEQLRTTSKFSQNHDNVAVIFCSIVNFNDFYEEAYEGGKECIRVLHELISDFDNLLNEPKYKEVEKIKTIGSTYMAACGLRPSENSNDVNTLITLMDFANEMMIQIGKFNEDVLSMTIGAFNFVLRIGYNHGKLTSGVIGTTKLLYDIWGDTVNVASRMDSTGLPGHIQVTEHSMKVLSPYYEFEKRGEVKVRGKGDMTTYLLGKKKPTPQVEVS